MRYYQQTLVQPAYD